MIFATALFINDVVFLQRVHPLLVDRIKCKSNQRKPAMLYVDSLSIDKCSDTTRVKRYKYQKAVSFLGYNLARVDLILSRRKLDACIAFSFSCFYSGGVCGQ